MRRADLKTEAKKKWLEMGGGEKSNTTKEDKKGWQRTVAARIQMNVVYSR